MIDFQPLDNSPSGGSNIDFQPADTPQQPQQGVIGAVREALKSRPELQPYGAINAPQAPSGPISGAIQAAQQTLGSPIRIGQTIGQLPDASGQAIAQEGGRFGYPKTAATIGTGVAIAPAILSAYAGLRSIYQSANPTLQGLLNSPKELSPQYEAQNDAMGVNRDLPVNTSSRNPVYETPERIVPTKQPRPIVPAQPITGSVPIAYPDDPGAFLEYADNKLESGNEINPQELMDWRTKLQTDMASDKIPQFDKKGNITKAFQQASDINRRASQLFNQIADSRLQGKTLPPQSNGIFDTPALQTRTALSRANTIANKQQAINNFIKKVAVFGTGGGASLRAISDFISYLKK